MIWNILIGKLKSKMKLKKCFPKLKQKKNSIEKETKKFQPNNKI